MAQPSKLDYARRVAAALCYIGLANLDRVNIISYADKVKGELAPQRGKGASSKSSGFSKNRLPAAKQTRENPSRRYCTETRRRGLAVVISDFFDPSGFQTGLDILRHFSTTSSFFTLQATKK